MSMALVSCSRIYDLESCTRDRYLQSLTIRNRMLFFEVNCAGVSFMQMYFFISPEPFGKTCNRR